jgi:hypothetical protein
VGALDLDRALASYRSDGYARLPRCASAEAIGAMRERIDDLMLGRVDVSPFFFQHDTTTGRYEDLRYAEGFVGPSLNYRKLEKLERDPIFAAWIENPLFERIAHAIVGPEIALYRAIVMAKAPAGPLGVGGTELPWHQDAGALWGLDRDPQLQIWTALDDATEASGCLRVVPGSHREGLATPLGGMIPAERAEVARAAERAVSIPVEAGDVVLLHNLVWHGSGVNRTTNPRRGMSVCFLDAATRCVRKRRAPRSFRRLFAGTSPSGRSDR